MSIASSFFKWFGRSFRPQTGTQYTGPEGPSSASVVVNDDRAFQIATAFSCIRLLAEIPGTLPLKLFKKTKGGREEATNHPLYRILHDTPNQYQTAIEFKETMQLHLASRGNTYAQVTRNAGNVTALLPLYASAMEPHLHKSGVVSYKYQEETGITEYGPEDILHIRLFGPGPLIGLSPLSYARQALGMAVSIEDSTNKLFANGMRPGGVVYNDTATFLNTEQRELLRSSLAQKHAGTDNAFRTLVLEGGYKYEPVTLSPEDAQMLEQWSFSIEEICRFFRVPPQLIGQTDKASSWASSLENLNLYFLQYSLVPYLKKWEQAIARRLLTVQERTEGYYAEFSVDALQRSDFRTQSEGYAKALGGPGSQGYMTINEVRRKQNLPDVEDGDEVIRATGPSGNVDGTQAPIARIR